MTVIPPPDLLPRARQILLPLVATRNDREALLVEAFYVHDPLLYAIDREGAPKTFLVNCLKTLLDHGCLPGGEHALARLLATAKTDCGADKHAEIDELIGIANGLRGATSTVALRTSPEPEARALQTIDTPRDDRRPTVFISYSRRDGEHAKRLIASLNLAGHACWIDTSSIKGGDEWVLTIADGILNSYALVVIVTTDALNSKWVKKEILWAEQRKKRIIPWVIEDVLDEAGFFSLIDHQPVKLFECAYDDAVNRLLAGLPPVEAAPAATPPPEHSTRKLELAWLERLRLEELLNTEKYTPLGGASQQRRAEMRAVFQLMRMGKDREEIRETKRFENAVEEIRRLRRAVLLGEPGGGKTTTIWKLASEL
ncbi:MAG: TIR domain-containing protein, partial [Blastocatellia bacterium]